MMWNVKILALPSSDTQTMVSVSFDNGAYLFGTGESANRVLSTTHTKLSKFKAIFAHGVESEQAGGLGGLLLSTAPSPDKTHLGGPRTLDYLVASMRSYIRRDQIGINFLPFDNGCDPVYQDSNVTIHTVRCFPSTCSNTLSNLDQIEIGSSSSKSGSNQEGSSPLKCVVPPHKQSTSPTPKSQQIISPSSSPSASITDRTARTRQAVLFQMFSHNLDWKFDSESQYSHSSESLKKVTLPLPPGAQLREAVSYIITGPELRGKFDVQKANNLNVAPKQRNELASGKSVFVDGKEVKPEDVLGEKRDPESIAIVYIPTLEHLGDLIDNAAWKMFDAKDRHLRVMIHAVPDEIFLSESYTAFMKKFSSCEHVIANKDSHPDRFAFHKSATQSLKLTKIAGEHGIFNFPHQSLDIKNVKQLAKTQSLAVINRTWTFGKQKLTRDQASAAVPESINFTDPYSKQADDYCELTTGQTWSEVLEVSEWTRKHISNLTTHPDMKGSADEVTLTALGTGSAMPSDYRNVSCTIVHLPNDRGCIMLDCGESSWAQMKRMWGPEKAKLILKQIKLVFISHMHADHHMGLVALLSARRTIFPDIEIPLYIVGPEAMLKHLKERSELEDLGISEKRKSIQYISNHSVDYQNFLQDQSISHDVEKVCQLIGLKSLSTCLVSHRARCSGLIIQSNEGWKLVYSGDTRPCGNLVNAGLGADILIHEATMEDDLVEMAFEKGHSTVQQALDIASRMKAKHVFLTHISQRYPKIQISSAEVCNPSKICTKPIATLMWDFMSVKVKDAWKVGHLMKPIKYLYASTDENEDSDTAGSVNQIEKKSTASKRSSPIDPPEIRKQQKLI